MSTPRKEPFGRPSTYTPEIGEFICQKISTSTLGTNKLCALHEEFPDETTIYDWRRKYDDFAQKYALAKSKQAELMGEKLVDICMEVDTYEDEKGVTRIDPGMLGRQRLLVDTMKWYASKLAPKIYGDRIVNENKNENASNIEDIAVRVSEINKSKESSY